MRFRKKRPSPTAPDDRSRPLPGSDVPVSADPSARLDAPRADAAAPKPPGFWGRLPKAGRILLLAWAGLATATLATGATLAWLGPLPKPAAPAAHGTPAPAKPAAAHLPSAPQHNQPPVPDRTAASPPTASAAPSLPAPGQLPTPSGPVVALVIDDVGFSADLTGQALVLPSAIGVVVSPYLSNASTVADEARAHGHAVLLSLPMEPSQGARDDEGPRQLGGTHTPQEDQDALTWALSRVPHPDGVTDLASGMTGGAFVSSPDFDPIARRLAEAHLAFIEAEPGRARTAPGVTADISIDGDSDAAGIDRQLAALTSIAARNRHALGVASPLTPTLLARVTEWSKGLQAVRLVPVSRLTDRQAPSPLETVAVSAAPLPASASPVASGADLGGIRVQADAPAH